MGTVPVVLTEMSGVERRFFKVSEYSKSILISITLRFDTCRNEDIEKERIDSITYVISLILGSPSRVDEKYSHIFLTGRRPGWAIWKCFV